MASHAQEKQEQDVGTVITTIGRRQLILLFNFGTACELKFICLNFFTVGQNGLLKVENLSLVN